MSVLTGVYICTKQLLPLKALSFNHQALEAKTLLCWQTRTVNIRQNKKAPGNLTHRSIFKGVVWFMASNKFQPK